MKQEQTPVCLCLRTLVHQQHESVLDLVSFFPSLKRFFEILITQHTYQMPSISIVSLALCSYLHVHLCLSSVLLPAKEEQTKASFHSLVK